MGRPSSNLNEGIIQFTVKIGKQAQVFQKQKTLVIHNYYSEEFLTVEGFTEHLTKVFSLVYNIVKKGISTHIKEIHAFQKYFESSYRPDDLS